MSVVTTLAVPTDLPVPVDGNPVWSVTTQGNKAVLTVTFESGASLEFQVPASGLVKSGSEAAFTIPNFGDAKWSTFERHVKFEVTFPSGPPKALDVAVNIARLGCDLASDGQGGLVVSQAGVEVGRLPSPFIDYVPDGSPGPIRTYLPWVVNEPSMTLSLPALSATEWATATLDPTVTTTLASTNVAGKTQRAIGRCQNGVLWAAAWDGTTSTTSSLDFYYSDNDGDSWSLGGSFGWSGTGGSVAGSLSFFIDLDDYIHAVYHDRNSADIMYRRGTLDTARTSVSWSSPTTVLSSSSALHHPNLVAHREPGGTGWYVHIVFGVNASSYVYYRSLAIAANGTVTLGTVLSLDYTGSDSSNSYPTIDFHHTGDGKTVQSGTPHLYVSYSHGSAGGIKFVKLTYSNNTWTPGTLRTIDSARRNTIDLAWCNTIFDGTRVVIAGFFNTATAGVYDLVIYERDAADTTTTTRVLITGASDEEWMGFGAASVAANGDVVFIGRANTSFNGTRTLHYRRWVRASTSLTAAKAFSAVGTGEPLVSAISMEARGRIDFVYYESGPVLKHFAIGNVEGLLALSGEGSLRFSGATTMPGPHFEAPFTIEFEAQYPFGEDLDGRRLLDRTSNGTLWAVFDSLAIDTALVKFAYSTDDGVSWSFVDGPAMTGSTTTYGVFFASIHIDSDDYMHFVYRDMSSGRPMYRRGTPGVGHTSWSWSSPSELYNSTIFEEVVVVGHPEGTGWVAHVMMGYNGTPYYIPVTISSGGVQTVGALVQIGAGSGAILGSLDFHHTGDGKTVQGGTPHLYAAWACGSTGTTYGIRFRKATYSGGSWTWGTERSLDSTRSAPSGWNGYWMQAAFDGTRMVIAGGLGPTTNNGSVVVYERDAADTTTTTRVYTTGMSTEPTKAVLYGAMGVDADGDVLLIGQDLTGTSTTRKMQVHRWVRSSNTWTVSVIKSDVASGRASRTYPVVEARRMYFMYEPWGSSVPRILGFGKFNYNTFPGQPTALDASKSGSTVTATFTHNDADGDALQGHRFRWRPVIA